MTVSADRLAELRSQGGYFPLRDRALLRVTGADRLRYLNGQTSNDLRRLEAAGALWTLVLTAKGKLCALALAWQDGDAILLESTPECAESLLARLERYAISDDVAFEPVETLPTAWHVFGPASDVLPGRPVKRIGLAGRDVEAEPTGVLLATPEEIEFLRIQHGIPRWGAEIEENTLPQEAGLEQFAVDFHKGCYVGQEIVSRLKSVGRVNRRLSGFVGETASQGASIVNPLGKTVGRITSFAPQTTRIIALGYLSSSEEGTDFSLQNESGACLGRVERCEFPLVSA